LIKSHKVLLFHFCNGNSHIIVNALHPLPNLNAFINICRRSSKGATFVNMSHITNDAAAFAKKFNHSIKNYWLVCNKPFSVLFCLQKDIVITSITRR